MLQLYTDCTVYRDKMQEIYRGGLEGEKLTFFAYSMIFT